MSIILYANGQLAADTRSLQDNRNLDTNDYFTAHTVTKLKVLGMNTMAVAVCGSVPTASDWHHIEQVLMRCLITAEVMAQSVVLSEAEAIEVMSNLRHFLVMTRSHTYYIEPTQIGSVCYFTRIGKDTPLAKGTGSKEAYMALRIGKTAEQAAIFATMIEPTCGGKIDSVLQTSLTQLKELA